MATVWFVLIAGSLILMLIYNPDAVLAVMTISVTESFELCIKLAGVYCIWLGFIEVMRQIGALDLLGTLLRPLIRCLYGELNPKARDYVIVNMSANLIGVANASTPTAINAIKEMGKGKTKVTRAMAMLFLINASGLEIMPSTVMGMRAAAGSANPADIFFPCIIITIVTTGLSILFAFLFFKEKEKSKDNAIVAAPAAIKTVFVKSEQKELTKTKISTKTIITTETPTKSSLAKITNNQAGSQI